MIFRITFTFIFALLLFSCSDKEGSITIDGPSSMFRLKHLTTEEAVLEALGNFTTGWELDEVSITNMGPYPKFPYVYYYHLLMNRDNGGGSYKEIIRLTVGVGGSAYSDATLEEFLEEHKDMEAVNGAILYNQQKMEKNRTVLLLKKLLSSAKEIG